MLWFRSGRIQESASRENPWTCPRLAWCRVLSAGLDQVYQGLCFSVLLLLVGLLEVLLGQRIMLWAVQTDVDVSDCRLSGSDLGVWDYQGGR